MGFPFFQLPRRKRQGSMAARSPRARGATERAGCDRLVPRIRTRAGDCVAGELPPLDHLHSKQLPNKSPPRLDAMLFLHRRASQDCVSCVARGGRGGTRPRDLRLRLDHAAETLQRYHAVAVCRTPRESPAHCRCSERSLHTTKKTPPLLPPHTTITTSRDVQVQRAPR